MFFKKYKFLYQFKEYFKKYKSIKKVLIFVMIMASAVGLLLPYFISQRILGITEVSAYNVLVYSILIILIILIHHIFWFFWEYISSKLTNKVGADIRKDILYYLNNTKYNIVKNKTSGYYLERFNDDVDEVSSFLSNALGTFIDTITNVSFLVFIYFLSYQCGIIFTIGVLILYLIEYIKIKKDMQYTEILKAQTEIVNTKMNENYKYIKDINGLGISELIINNSMLNINEVSAIKIKKDKSFAKYSRIKTFLQFVIEAILIVYSVMYLIPSQALTIVLLLTIINYIGFMYDLVEQFAKMKDYFVKGDFKAMRILEIISKDNLIKYSNVNKVLDYSIQIKGLSYCYEDDNNKVLNNINLNIKSGTLNMFIGSSGVGKSTLFNLITKIIECEEKKIYIGNKDINSLDKETIKNTVCIVNQEPFLLNDTIIKNIRIVKPEATDEEIYDVCKIVNLDEEIKKMNNGYNTLIVENGNNLSGGQKQRLAIARAILKDTPILLFDEPTSALDKYNQEIFFNIVKQLKQRKTVLIIAHKLNDYTLFDNIYEIKCGSLFRVKECG